MTTVANLPSNPPQSPSNFGQLYVTNQIGMQISLPIASVADAYAKMRQMGALGWSSGDIPPGGIKLPYAMAETFDWSLIGAQLGECAGKKGVWYRNQFYAHRALAANLNKNMPAAIKYSRGASGTDDVQATEGDANGIQYVTLVIFKGNGRVIPALNRPNATAAA